MARARAKRLRDVARNVLEDYAGLTVVGAQEQEQQNRLLEEALDDVGDLRRTLNRLGYESFNYDGGRPTDLTPKARMSIVHKAQTAWAEDPQAGAAVDLRNAFVFGRGVPTPQAHEDEVQEVIDDTFADPANRRVLTSHAKLVEKGIDMQLQSNLFLLLFEDGQDGRVRLGLAEHDTIVQGVRHPDDRTRVLYYKAVRRRVKWSWADGAYTIDKTRPPEVGYYQALDVFADPFDPAADALDNDGGIGPPPDGQLFPGLLLHVAVNKRSEAIFGIPRFKRLLRWFNAYEQLMRTSIDLMKAAASIYMKATVRGGRQQLERASFQQIRRASPLTQMAVAEYAGSELMPTPPPAGPSILYDNPSINHEPFKLDPHADDVATIGGQARMQISAGTGLPLHFTGDASNVNLASASAIEPAVMAVIHEEQEVWEQVFRTFADRAIAKAIKDGFLTEWRDATDDETARIEAGEFEGDYDEVSGQVKRDLGYTFSLPDPLKRTLSDLVAALMAVAKQWDPLNTNQELKRFLFGLVLEQGLDVEDPREIVDQVFPKWSPEEQAQAESQAAAIALARSTVSGAEPEPDAKAPPSAVANGQQPTSTGVDGRQHTAQNPYGAKQKPQAQESSWELDPDEFRKILLEAAVSAHRGTRPRPDDPTFAAQQQEFERETTENMRRLLAAARAGNGNSGDSG